MFNSFQSVLINLFVWPINPVSSLVSVNFKIRTAEWCAVIVRINYSLLLQIAQCSVKLIMKLLEAWHTCSFLICLRLCLMCIEGSSHWCCSQRPHCFIFLLLAEFQLAPFWVVIRWVHYFTPILQGILLLMCVCLSTNTLNHSVLAVLRLFVPKLDCSSFQTATRFSFHVLFHTLLFLDFLLCYSATYLQLVPFFPLNFLYVNSSPCVFKRKHAHARARAFSSDEMQCRMSSVYRQLSLLITVCQSQKPHFHFGRQL